VTSATAVVGASGYAGGELLRLAGSHPDLELRLVTARSDAGRTVGEVHAQFLGSDLAEEVLGLTDPAALAECDLAFLALPHGESAALAAQLPDDVLVVDLGADFRLEEPAAWERFYPGPHAGSWVYGMPELPGSRAAVAKASRVANPGCYVTGISLALSPLLVAGLVETSDIVVVAASGTSGAGRGLKPGLLASQVMGSMSAYKVGGVHQHTPEIEQNLGWAAGVSVQVSFTPMLAPMPRGILATCTARARDGVDAGALREALAAQYETEPFVHLLPPGLWPETAAVAGSNAIHLQVELDTHTGRAIVVAALDNLVKGAAGQAIQNANLMLGLAETAGLSAVGVAP
jgi:N-acetyl-gamma-glutamyl-phosphate reductase